MTDTPDRFREFEQGGWQNAAAFYGDGFGIVTAQAVGPLLDAVNAGPGTHLLDVACGPGYAAAEAARRGCSVLGIDFASEMVTIARRLTPELEFQEGDAEDLRFAPETFDIVVMNFGMLHLARPEKAIAEAYRVLRTGGRYAFTVWNTPDNAVGFKIVLGAIQAHGDMNVPLPAGPPFFRFSEPAESTKALVEAGFQEVEIRYVPQLWKLQSGLELFNTMRTAAVRTAALLNMQKHGALHAIQREIEVQAETFRRGSGIELPMPAVLVSGLKRF
jgi:ubiquinone/menaquinone biosynthesis C-methylase UbiE